VPSTPCIPSQSCISLIVPDPKTVKTEKQSHTCTQEQQHHGHACRCQEDSSVQEDAATEEEHRLSGRLAHHHRRYVTRPLGGHLRVNCHHAHFFGCSPPVVETTTGGTERPVAVDVGSFLYLISYFRLNLWLRRKLYDRKLKTIATGDRSATSIHFRKNW